jgi:acetyl esterase/lipase
MKERTSVLHPELQRLAKKFPRVNFSGRNLWFWRFMNRIFSIRTAPKDILIKNIYISAEGNASRIRLRVYRSRLRYESAPALIWIHGGGYIAGRPEQDDPGCIEYVRQLGIVIVSVDYRCAPEYPFPSGLEDAYAALLWARSNAAQLGIDANRIALGGASAGGGLAAALAQIACDRNEVKLIFQMLVYPMLDDRTSIRTDIIDHGYLTWSRESNRYGWESYLGKECGARHVLPYSVPARREDLSGLPPAWIGVGSLDLFHDEDVAYAQRLRDCGVACELNIVSGAFHGFDMPGPALKVVQDFRQSQLAALRKYLLD